MRDSQYPQVLSDMFEKIVEVRRRAKDGERLEAIAGDTQLGYKLTEKLVRSPNPHKALRLWRRIAAVEMARAGKSNKEIAETLLLSSSYVQNLCANVRARRRPNRAAGKTGS